MCVWEPGVCVSQVCVCVCVWKAGLVGEREGIGQTSMGIFTLPQRKVCPDLSLRSNVGDQMWAPAAPFLSLSSGAGGKDPDPVWHCWLSDRPLLTFCQQVSALGSQLPP